MKALKWTYCGREEIKRRFGSSYHVRLRDVRRRRREPKMHFSFRRKQSCKICKSIRKPRALREPRTCRTQEGSLFEFGRRLTPCIITKLCESTFDPSSIFFSLLDPSPPPRQRNFPLFGSPLPLFLVQFTLGAFAFHFLRLYWFLRLFQDLFFLSRRIPFFLLATKQ